MCLNSRTSSQRLRSFFDEGTFTQVGTYMVRKGTDEPEGVVCGYGAVNGRLVFAFSQESDRMMGAFDDMHAKKLTMLLDTAVKNGAPLVGFFDSVGAVINEGAGVLAAYGRVMKAIADASGVIPTVAVVSGICGGTAAVAASMFDIVVKGGENAHLYLTPGQEKDGIFAVNGGSEEDAMEKVRTLLSVIPQNSKAGFAIREADLNRHVTPAIVNGRCDNRRLIADLSDDGGFLEIYAGDDGMITGFARIGGMGIGVIANDSSLQGGRITCKGARKAAKLISFCDSFGMPLVSLVDSDGIAENSCPASLSKLSMAYLTSTGAKITVYTGNGVGAAFNLMGAKSCGADMVFALQSSTLATMPPSGAVAFLWNDRVGEETRTSLEAAWRDEFAAPVLAAQLGEVDDVIDPCETRQRICSALMMLAGKSSTVSRKHVNFSL